MVRVGVIGANEIPNSEAFNDLFHDAINLTFAEYMKDREEELRAEGLEDGDLEDALERESDGYMGDADTYLLGDWLTTEDGKFAIDKNGEFAAVFDANSNVVCIEWSKTVISCGGTSPCYVQADGSGPCGDLTSDGDLQSYALPQEFMKEEEI